MKSVRFAICDDDEISLEILSDLVVKVCKKHDILAIVDGYDSGGKLLEYIGGHNYAAILIDMNMPKMNGIQLAKRLRSSKNCPNLIFVSGQEESVFSTFQVSPFAFIRKNKLDEDIDMVLSWFIEDYFDHGQTLEVPAAEKEVLIFKYSEIVYIESCKRVQYVHLVGNRTVEILPNMAELEEKLRGSPIKSVHRSYLVNYRYISRIDRTELKLTVGESIPLSRNRANEVREEYLKYICSKGNLNL